MVRAFDLADEYRHMVFVVADGLIGQNGPAELPPMQPLRRPLGDWALTGADGREKNIITSLELNAPDLEELNNRLQAKLAHIREHQQRSAEMLTEDARLIVVGYGTSGRIAETAVKQARREDEGGPVPADLAVAVP